MTLADLLLAWGRVGLLAFGGGPSMVPMMKAECVDSHGWLTEAEFVEALAIGNSLPGPIATKMGAFVGNRVAGPFGALVAVIGVVGPTALLMVAAAALLLRLRSHPAGAGALAGLKPVMIAMILWSALDLGPESLKGGLPAVLLALAALLALSLRVHPALVVIGAMGLGALLLR
jgi:chromate transporter